MDGERIVAASIRLGDREFDGQDHGFCYLQAREAGLDPDWSSVTLVAGFRTTSGRFLTRDEAEELYFGPAAPGVQGIGLISEDVTELQ